MKRVYITGIAGMLGGNLGYLLGNDYKICGVDKIAIMVDNIKTEQFNLLDFKRLEDSIRKFQPDYLIHTAALVSVDFCEENEELSKKMNTDLTCFLAELCNKISCRMIYISTDAVFDGKEAGLYKEGDAPNPVNIYGMTKYKGECAALKYGHTVLRTNIYGFNIQNKNSFGEWIYKSLLKGENLKMFTDIDFSPILVNDLADILMNIMEKRIQGLYHVCATGSITKYDFGMYLKHIFSIREGSIKAAISDNYPFKAVRSKHMGMDNKKISKILGITVATPKESIEKFFKLYSDGYDKKLKEWCNR